MRIAIYGSGSVGGYFGGRLALAGQNVIFIARGEHLAAMRANGLQVQSLQGDFTVRPVEAFEDPAEVGPVDVVLVGVKAWQVPAAARAMRPLMGENTLVVPLQNGVDAPTQLAATLDVPGSEEPHVIGGLCRISSLVAEPGVIRHAGMVPYIAFNRLDGRADPRVELLRRAFDLAGVNVEVPADIKVALWAKFAFIASLGGVGAVTRAPAGILRSLPETREMLETAVREVVAVARGHNVALPDETVASTLALVEALPPAGTASMQRDILEGRPSELESQNGAVVRLGRGCGVPAPLHAFIYASLLPAEKKARGEIVP